MTEIDKWISSLSYRRFNKKINDTSKIYWTSELGIAAIRNAVDGVDTGNFVVDEIGTNFDRRMIPNTIEEQLNWHDDYLKRLRLHLLIVVSASLESYLKDITFSYLAINGYLKPRGRKIELLKLTDVGTSLGGPILSRDSLPEPLKYAEKLFEVDFGAKKETWIRAYKLRCVAAHNGGMVMPGTLRKIPDLSTPEFGFIGIEWEELKKCMRAAVKIAKILDRKIVGRSGEIQEIEAEQALRIDASKNRLPQERGNLGKYLFDTYRLQVKRRKRDEFIQIFY